jgi:hypothetical protein
VNVGWSPLPPTPVAIERLQKLIENHVATLDHAV